MASECKQCGQLIWTTQNDKDDNCFCDKECEKEYAEVKRSIVGNSEWKKRA